MDMTESESAVVFLHLGIIIQRMAEAEVFDRSPSSAIPKSAMNCGEAAIFVPLLFAMLAKQFPTLADPDSLSELLQGAWLNSAGGKPN